jgi:hypothetical protein
VRRCVRGQRDLESGAAARPRLAWPGGHRAAAGACRRPEPRPGRGVRTTFLEGCYFSFLFLHYDICEFLLLLFLLDVNLIFDSVNQLVM